MEVTTFVREVIEEATLYAALTHQPHVADGFASPTMLAAFLPTLDTSFFNVFNQPCGYFQLKRFAAMRGQAARLSFVEDATEYRLTDDPALRAARYVAAADQGAEQAGQTTRAPRVTRTPHATPRAALT